MTGKGTFGSLHPRTLNLSFKSLTYGYVVDSLMPFLYHPGFGSCCIFFQSANPWPALGCLAGTGKGTLAELMPASAPPELSAFKIAMLDYRTAMELFMSIQVGLE